jgi:selenocysteine-specific elongation factor
MSEHAAYIVGTAGHVDHGKTTLIKALTGIDTDRLPEEKARGLSIDLGFAHAELPSGRVVGIVDVPGHERFLKNMLAGVGGYDLAMLVIDANEGIKPQTREHLEILQMLAIKSGLVALTKVDLLDPEYLPLVLEEVVAYLSHTFLQGAPVVPVSSVRGDGLDILRETLDRLLEKVPPRPLDVPFRLPVDRVFVKPGFGTVVTGSLWSGRLAKGDKVHILPAGLESRVRTLQVFGSTMETAVAGQRVAINLAGLDAEQIHRGDTVCAPDTLQATLMADVQLEVLPRVPRPVRNRAWTRVYAGTQEVLAKVVLLEADEVPAGGSGLAQLLLSESTTLDRLDRFVLRNATAEYTLGGGTVLDAHPPVHRRKDQAVVEVLTYKGEGEHINLLMAQFLQDPTRPFQAPDLVAQLSLDKASIERLLGMLVAQHDVETVHDGRAYMLGSTFHRLAERITELLSALQKAGPHRSGWRKDELTKMFLDHSNKLVDAVLHELVRRGTVVDVRGRFALNGHRASLDPTQDAVWQRIKAEIEKNEFAPPALEDLQAALHPVDPRLFRLVWEHLTEAAVIVFITKDIYFLTDSLGTMRQRIADFVVQNGSMTPAQCRDVLGTTRKYVIPLLEHLDETRFTKRQGDARVLA